VYKNSKATRDQELMKNIAALDKAMDKTRAPFGFLTYMGCDYDVDHMEDGKEYLFKAFRSTSIDAEQAETFTGGGGQGYDPSRKRKKTIMQIRVPEGSPGIYVEKLTSVTGEKEFILPRNSKIRVKGNPKKIDFTPHDSYKSGKVSNDINVVEVELLLPEDDDYKPKKKKT
jgi:hypothetical protein